MLNKNNLFKSLGLGVITVIGHHYGSKALDRADITPMVNWFKGVNTNDTTDTTNHVETLEECRTYLKQAFELFSYVKTDIKAMSDKQNLSERDNALISASKAKVEELEKDAASLIDVLSTKPSSEDIGLEIAKRMQSGMKELSDVLAEVKKTGSNLISDFIGDFDLNNFYSYLDGLSLHQEGALFNIFVLLVILLTIFSILGVFFGNEIIKYLDLENKHPRLSKFFKVRAKLQRYYLMWNIFILLSLSIFALFINILALSFG